MKNALKLLAGEIKRLVRYKILPISLATSLIWVIIFLFIKKEEARELAPLLILMDVAVMSIILIGASLHLEKQEGTMKAMLVMPVSLGEILTAKIAASMVLALESAIIVSVALYIIYGFIINYGLLILYILIASVAHAAIGFFLAIVSRDFTSMLGLMMAYMLVFTMPSILYAVKVFDISEWILFISPIHSTSLIITSAVSGEGESAKIIACCAYLFVLSAVLLRFIIYPKFKNKSVRG